MVEFNTLLDRCRAGDDLAWEALVRRYQGRVFGIFNVIDAVIQGDAAAALQRLRLAFAEDRSAEYTALAATFGLDRNGRVARRFQVQTVRNRGLPGIRPRPDRGAIGRTQRGCRLHSRACGVNNGGK